LSTPFTVEIFRFSTIILTVKNFKFKKLVLLTMQINDTNQKIMNLSTNKIVNLHLFASVLMTSYNIVSVMVKTTLSKYKDTLEST
ncbi:uncharacterized protein LOC111039812, partial [Myzus persicae]|uniref:uncharacterized protein LOC111039812 n=1 Tax=Myzus persicae TaxID=13164 RepID=UPI000B937659